MNITKNWDVKFDYTYDRQTSETNSSVTQYEAGATWYAPTAWIENGSQVFVNEQGERVDTGGMPAYRFPVENIITVQVRELVRSAIRINR